MPTSASKAYLLLPVFLPLCTSFIRASFAHSDFLHVRKPRSLGAHSTTWLDFAQIGTIFDHSLIGAASAITSKASNDKKRCTGLEASKAGKDLQSAGANWRGAEG
jgi:hypothetical protein